MIGRELHLKGGRRILPALAALAVLLAAAAGAVALFGADAASPQTGGGGIGYEAAPAAALSDEAGGPVAKIGENTYNSLALAIKEAANGDTVTLLKNTEIGTWCLINGKTVTLDLATYMVSFNVQGSDSYGLGFYIVNDADVTIENGSIVRASTDVKTEMLIGAANCKLALINVAVDVGKCNADAQTSAIYCYAGVELDVGAGSTVTGNPGIVLLTDKSGSKADTVRIAGTVKDTGGLYAPLMSHGTNTLASKIEIVDGANIEAKSSCAVYLPGMDVMTVSGGTVSGGTGIEIRGGSLTVTGGVITGTADEFKGEPNGGGATTVGAGIAVAQHTTGHPIDVVIDGGKVSGIYALYEWNPQGNEQSAIDKVKLSVRDGEFAGGISSVDEAAFIDGGTFSSALPASYLAEGAMQNDNGEVGALDDVAVAEINGAKYATLAGAVDAASDGDTVKLLKSVTLNAGSSADPRYNLFIQRSLTLDGAGFTVTNGLERGIGVNAQNVTFRNITIENANDYGRCIDTRGGIGTLVLDGATLTAADGAGNTQVLTIGGSQSEPASIKIRDSALTANGDGYCVIMFNPVNLEISGSTLTGWADLYFKGSMDGACGTAGSTARIVSSALNSANPHSGEGNSFSAVQIESTDAEHQTNLRLAFEDCKVNVSSTGDQCQEFIAFNSTDYSGSGTVNYISGGNSVLISGSDTAFAFSGERAVMTSGYEASLARGNLLQISGGTFTRDPSAYLADDYAVVKVGDVYEVRQTFDVTWKDGCGGVIRTDSAIPQGTSISKPDDPLRDGYTFSGWNPEVPGTMPAEDLVITAVWTPKEYKVVFHSAGDYYSQTFTFDAPAELRSAGTRAGYAFGGWAASDGGPAKYSDGQEICVRPYTERVDLYAIWEAETYAVSAAPAENGTVDVSPNAACGSTVTVTLSPAEGYVVASLSAEPEVEFSGDGDVRTFTMPASDVIITATFAKSLSTVTWADWDGTVLETDGDVPYGEIPVYNRADPAREPTAEFDYAFSGWSPEISSVTGDVTYTAAYAETVRTYTITWKGWDGTVLETEENVPYGAAVAWKGASTPARESTPEFEYTFTGWNPAVDESTTVTGDMEFLAQFESVKRSYDIVFIVDGVETLKSVEYGATPAYDGAPVKEADVQYSYAFDGWEPEIAAVSGPATYTAVFTETLRTYTVTVLAGDHGTVDGTSVEAEYGTAISADGCKLTIGGTVVTAVPDDAYAFEKWTPAVGDGATVAGDVTYTASFIEAGKMYTVTWKNWDGEILLEETVEEGAIPAYTGDAPAREADAQYTYTFSCWDPEVAAAVADVEYTAVFKQTVRTYTVTVVAGEHGTVDETSVEAEYGTAISADGCRLTVGDKVFTAAPDDAYAFDKWTPAVEDGAIVAGDVTYVASFIEAGKTYTVTWKNWNGDVLLEDVIEAGAVPVYAGEAPAREADAQYSYAFSGWDPEVAAAVEDAEYTAVFEQTVRTYIVTVAAGEHGTVDIASAEAEYGTAISADGCMLTVGDKVFTAAPDDAYVFDKWTPAVEDGATVVGDVTYTAVFAAEPEPEPEDEGGDGGSTLLYVGIAVAAIAIIGVGAFILLRRRS